MTTINLDNGKYQVIHENGAGLHALRHGAPWRDLGGDGLVLAMAQEIEDLRDALKLSSDCLVKCLTGGEVSAKLAGKSIEQSTRLLEASGGPL